MPSITFEYCHTTGQWSANGITLDPEHTCDLVTIRAMFRHLESKALAQTPSGPPKPLFPETKSQLRASIAEACKGKPVTRVGRLSESERRAIVENLTLEDLELDL